MNTSFTGSSCDNLRYFPQCLVILLPRTRLDHLVKSADCRFHLLFIHSVTETTNLGLTVSFFS